MTRSGLDKRIIIIGSSTGGPLVLERIFSGLPKLPVTIIIIQHIRAFFIPDLRSHIQAQTGMHVAIAGEGQNIQSGMVYIAPAEKHLVVKSNRVFSLQDSEKVNSVRPSVDVTMQSIRREPGISIMGIILTGMGRDGTEGLAYLKSIGGTTIVQDPVTAPIRTMPQNAIDSGGIDAICTPEMIQEVILKFSSSLPSEQISEKNTPSGYRIPQ
jgi:two-component system chemotaxis response regulator CheB